MGALRQAIGFDGPSCWALADPGSLLPTGHGITGADEAFESSVPRLTALHQGYEAVSDRSMASSEQPVATLSMSTGGDLAKNQLWDECMRPHGVGDSFFLACRDRYGNWGWVNASRGGSEQPFTDEDVRLLNDVSASLGAAMRRIGSDMTGRHADAPPPGVIICDRHLRETSRTPPVHDWLARLPDGTRWQRQGLLPPAVYGVAGRLLADGNRAAGVAARARVLTTTGTWTVLDGAMLEGDSEGRVAITIRPATANEVLEILARTYELTWRERELVWLVADGLSTRQLAERLFITPYTVQDHLKAIFGKAGVRTRAELVSRMTGIEGARGGTAAES